MSVEFNDNRIQVKGVLNDKAIAFLDEAASEIESAAARNTKADSGQLKGAWTHVVDENALEATVGNPLKHAIWYEMGTGEFALNRNGRRGGWLYKDDSGKWRFTYGMYPRRPLHNAFISLKPAIISYAKQIFGDLD